MPCLSPALQHMQSAIRRLHIKCLTLRPLLAQSASQIRCRTWKMEAREFADLSTLKPMIGVCQMTVTDDKEKNFEMCKALIRRAKKKGAQMVFLPEATDYIAASKAQSMAMAEPLSGDLMTRYRQVASDNQVWLSIGGFHEKGPEGDSRVLNTHVIIGADGEIHGTYSKTHLYDVDIKGKVTLKESDYTIPGKAIHPPVQTPVGKVGMSICYDVRFPELSLVLAQQGADILTFPSAFAVSTGLAHWEVLMRSRAIETQTYVVAAAQTGSHNEKRNSYGHALVVDPWGTVIGHCKEGMDVCVVEVDLSYRDKIRQQMPVWQHRRYDLYSQVQPLAPLPPPEIDSQAEYTFGQVKVKSNQVFYRSSLSFCFVNIKPVLPGHVVVSSLRPALRLSDLSQEEVADMFQTAQKVARVVEKHFKATSSTLAIQDGEDAGQTVKHVHAHIIPRHKGDLVRNDEIYDKLESHDKDMTTGLRSDDVMAKEAAQLRSYFQ